MGLFLLIRDSDIDGAVFRKSPPYSGSGPAKSSVNLPAPAAFDFGLHLLPAGAVVISQPDLRLGGSGVPAVRASNRDGVGRAFGAGSGVFPFTAREVGLADGAVLLDGLRRTFYLTGADRRGFRFLAVAAG